MKRNNLIDAINEVDDFFIEEAAISNKKRAKRSIIKWTAVAAGFLIILGSLPMIAQNGGINSIVQYFSGDEVNDFHENEYGYKIISEIKKFKINDFGNEIVNLKEDIINDYKNYSLTSSKSAGYLIFKFDSYKEAVDFIGLKDFSSPIFSDDAAHTSVSIVGEPNGDVTYIYLDTLFKFEHTNVQICAHIFTENSVNEEFELNYILNNFKEHDAAYEISNNGLNYVKINSKNEDNDRLVTSGHFTYDGIYYTVNVSSETESKSEAEDIFTETINSFSDEKAYENVILNNKNRS